MNIKFPRIQIPVGWFWASALAVAAVIGFFTYDRWWPSAHAWVQSTIAGNKKALVLDDDGHGSGDDHAGHDHGDHAHGHDETNSLELSKQAMGNIGLSPDYLRPVELETFQRAITVPAIVVERPGRTRIEVSTPMAGVITHVHAVRGEAVRAGALLFEIRITAEELVATQTELLKTIGDLEVENREIARLRDVTRSGAVPQKTLLERQYAKDKLEVLLAAQKEALRLQGLSEQQISEITENRRLLRDLQIVAPAPDDHSHEELRLTRNPFAAVSYLEPDEDPHPPEHPAVPGDASPTLILQEVLVHKGETVAAGTTLAVVSDMSELFIEGRGFEQDTELISTAANEGWPVTALFERAGQRTERVDGLELLYSASDVDVESRMLRFYVRLPNKIIRSVPSPNGLTYIEWKFRPGQRLQLRVPVEEWKEQIVLPVDAIAQEGAESYVFLQNGDHFDRVPVHVLYRDQSFVVIKNDGLIFPGDVVARRGAHQMQMALKNKSGGGVDPHAGHSH